MTTNLRTVLQSALDRKQVPPFNHPSMRDLAHQLHVGTARTLIASLNQLPPASITYSSAPIKSGDATGSAQVVIRSDGQVSFQGNVDLPTTNFAQSHYVSAMVFFDVKDSSGKIITLVHSNTLGTAIRSDATDSWDVPVSVEAVTANWHKIKSGSATIRSLFRWEQTVFDVVSSLFDDLKALIVDIASQIGPEVAQWILENPEDAIALITA